MSDSLPHHGLQHARLPCPSPSLGSCSNSCVLSLWCHPTISLFVTHFFCPQSFPALGSFLMSQLFASGGQGIGASASASVPPMYIRGWFPLGLADLISLQSKGLSTLLWQPWEANEWWNYINLERTNRVLTQMGRQKFPLSRKRVYLANFPETAKIKS